MFAFADPIENTKPSRLNRRRKKKWRLTDSALCGIVTTHSQETRVSGVETRFLWRLKRRPYNQAFFYARHSARRCAVSIVMAGLFGQRSALAVSESGFPPQASPSPMPWKALQAVYSLSLELPQ